MSYATHEDAFNLLCGDLIARGAHRKVFTCKLRDDLVVKVEDDENRRFANVLETEFWHNHQYYEPVAKWLAPVVMLSPDGRLLLQKRCDVPSSDFKWPEKVPAFLTDLKVGNFGLFNGRLVCFDYALTIPNPSPKPRKAKWLVDM
jgi:hypothetical protein